MRSKKGSLNLSIEAIVVLVMAITMLGLGLAFIRSKFTSAGNLLDEVNDGVREQVQAQLASTDKKAYIPKTQFEIKSGGSEVALLGIKNTEISVHDFNLAITKADDSASCSPGTECGHVKFTYSPTYNDVSPGENQLIPIKIQVTESGHSELFLLQVTMDTGAQFTTKQFFVKGIN